MKFKRCWKKYVLLKPFSISQVVMQALVVPEKVLIKINRLLFRFLWRKKNCNRRAFEKVNRSVLCNDVDSGGLNMIDFERYASGLFVAVGFASMQGEQC